MTGMIKRAICLLALAWPILAAEVVLTAETASGAELRVIVTDFSSETGQIIARVFDDRDAFPSKPDKMMMAERAVIQEGQAVATFSGLEPGTYAVVIAHDQNLNNRVDRGFLGIPTEDVVFSNNARISLGPPSFDEAAIVVDQEDVTVRVQMSRPPK